MKRLVISANTAAIADLQALLARALNASETLQEVVDLVDFLKGGVEVPFHFERIPASGAGYLRIIAKPSERLRELMAAVRAVDGEGLAVQHGQTSAPIEACCSDTGESSR